MKSSPSLLWLLDFNVNELIGEGDEISAAAAGTPRISSPDLPEKLKDSLPIVHMKTRKSSRLSAKRMASESSEGFHPQQIFDLDPDPPPTVARFEECSSSSSSEPANSINSNNSVKKKKRMSKSARFTDSESFDTTTPSPSNGLTIAGSESYPDFDKPKCTYTELIEKALNENPKGLTVSQIYSWIANNHTYFRLDDDRWKNSVRHNLSINPYFEKLGKCKNGAGHVWTIAESCRKSPGACVTEDLIDKGHGSGKDKHGSNTVSGECFKTETERIVGGILQQYKMELNNNQQLNQGQTHQKNVELNETQQLPQPEPGDKQFGNDDQDNNEFQQLLNEHTDLLITNPSHNLLPAQESYYPNGGNFVNENSEGRCGGQLLSEDRIYEFLSQNNACETGAGHEGEASLPLSVQSEFQQPQLLGPDFNELELLTFENLGGIGTDGHFVIITSSSAASTTANVVAGLDNPVDQEMCEIGRHTKYPPGVQSQCIEIQSDHLFHEKEFYLDDDEQQISTLQL